MCAGRRPRRFNASIESFERLQVADEQIAFAMPVCPFFRPAQSLGQWLKQNAVYAEFFGPLHIFGQLRHGFPHDNTDQRDAHCGPLAFNAANYFGYDVVEPGGSAITVVNGRILAVEREGDMPQAGVHQVAIVTFGLKGQTIRDEVDRKPEMNGPADDVVDSRLQQDLSADKPHAERARPGVQFAYSGVRRTAFRGEAEQDSGLIPNSIPGARRTRIPG